jgi:hypothetical protein
MNIGDIWQEHRRFITIVGAGGLILLIAYFTINAIYSGKAQRLSSDIERARSAQRQAALPAGADIRKIQADRERLERETADLVGSVAHTPADKWLILPSVADPDLHYNQQIDGLRNGVLELAALRNIDVDQRLGLPDTFPGSRADIEHYLRGLDVIEAVVSTALAAEQVHEAGIARIERIEITRPPKAKPANERKVPFVSAIKVDHSIIGHPKAIDWFLRNFAADAKGEGRAGRYLAIEGASIKSLDLPPNATGKEKRGADPMDRRRVECRMSILALTVNPEGQVL